MISLSRSKILSITRRQGSKCHRWFTKSFLVRNEVAVSSAANAEYTFKYPKSEEIYLKLIKLPVEDIHTLSDLINQRLGIIIKESDKRGFNAANVVAGGEVELEEKVEKTVFDVKLIGFDAKMKIKVIKEIRSITGLGLKEAKELVEGAESGSKVVKKDMKKEEAEQLKNLLEAAGATVEVS